MKLSFFLLPPSALCLLPSALKRVSVSITKICQEPIYAYEEACLICARPTKLSFDNQNDLHAEAEPAIEYADGFKVYAHHGVLLPEQYGKLPTTEWQSCWLLEEKNAELRRVLIQAIGYERICEERKQFLSRGAGEQGSKPHK